MRKRSIFTAFEGAHLDGALFGATDPDRKATLRNVEEGRRRSLLWPRAQSPTSPAPGDTGDPSDAKPRP